MDILYMVVSMTPEWVLLTTMRAAKLVIVLTVEEALEEEIRSTTVLDISGISSWLVPYFTWDLLILL